MTIREKEILEDLKEDAYEKFYMAQKLLGNESKRTKLDKERYITIMDIIRRLSEEVEDEN